MKIIAFVCEGNSFKSIICEKFAKELTNDFIIVSGGTNPATRLNLEGESLMKKKGLSMTGYKPHSINDLPKNIDYLIKMGCTTECPLITSKNTFDFNMDKYPSKTSEEKQLIINILEEKVQDFIAKISK